LALAGFASQPSLPSKRVFVVQLRRQPRGRVKGAEFEVSTKRSKKMNAHTSTIERVGAEMERLAAARPPARQSAVPRYCRWGWTGAAGWGRGGPLGGRAGGNSFHTAAPVVRLSGGGALTRQVMLLPFTALSSCGHTPESC